MAQEQQSIYAHGKNAGIMTHRVYGGVRIFLTGLYFGTLIPMVNELVLCVLAWCKAGELPNLTDLCSAAFLMAWSPIAFGYSAFLAGMLFAVLLSLFKNKVIACLVAPVVCVVLTVIDMRQYVYVENNVAYYLSATMQWVSSVNAGILGMFFAVLACTVLKSIFMPLQLLDLNAAQDVEEAEEVRQQPCASRDHLSHSKHFSGSRVAQFLQHCKQVKKAV